MTDADEADEGDEGDEVDVPHDPAGADDPGSTDGDGATDGSEGDGTDGATGGDPEPIGIVEARRRAIALAREDLEYDVDGVVKVSAADDGDGWRVLIEVVEREAVPDTNDILGRYELQLSPTGDLVEFGLVERYRRDELREEL